GVAVLDEQLLALAVGEHPLVNGVEVRRLDRAVHLAPPDLVFARRLADDELVVRRAAGVLAGAADQRAVDRDRRLAAADRLFVQRRHAQVRIHPGDIRDAVHLKTGLLLLRL